MSKDLTLFPKVVGCIFDLWPIFQAAIRESWGGIDTTEKGEWMKETISDYVLQGKNEVDFPFACNSTLYKCYRYCIRG
jgi:hypothetical protein